ncbi:MAG: FMN-binding protein [Clostridia bacterium]|nr:FMN-binding protein [Clostridia bacterium]
MKKSLFVQSLKTVFILVAICLVCGALLALANDLFFVDDATKFAQTAQSIYPGFVVDQTLEVDSSFKLNYGTVNSVTKSKDGGYILDVTGTGGYNNGTVTLYVGVNAKGHITGWSIKDNVGQSFISKITSNHQKSWYIPINDSVEHTVADTYDMEYSTAAGATFTSTAINHAINVAAKYCHDILGLGAKGVK